MGLVIIVRSVEKTNARAESSSARVDASGVTPSNEATPAAKRLSAYRVYR